MINYNEIGKGTKIIINNQPYEIVEYSTMFKGRGHSTLQAKLKNLITNEIMAKTFHPSDSFQEAEVDKMQAKFIYSHKDKFIFTEGNDPSKRFELTQEQVGRFEKLLKPNQEVEAILFKDEVINISLPIKIQLKVIEAPPGIKGDRSSAGNKLAKLETGIEINVPLFVEEGDTIEINTEKQEYTRRIK